MQYRHSLTFDRMPAPWRAYSRILVARKPVLVPESVEIPRMEARMANVPVDAARLAAYRELCGGAESTSLPLAYPHVLTAPLQLALLSSEAFPLRLPGLVHRRNVIVRYRDLDASEPCEAFVWIEGHRETPRGHEFDVHAQLISGAQIVWAETSTYLSRSRTAGLAARPAPRDASASGEIPGSSRTASFRAPTDIGRRYARLSGDYNPIHLSSLAAKLFGFRGAIAHGMWTLARSAAELETSGVGARCRFEVDLLHPVQLPAALTLQWWSTASGRAFELRDANGQKPHLAGFLAPEA